VIGYISVQTGSLLPCIVYHFTHNTLGLLASKIYISPESYARYPGLENFIVHTRAGGQDLFTYGWPLILGGSLLACYLLLWLYRLPYQKTSEEQLQEALDHQGSLELS